MYLNLITSAILLISVTMFSGLLCEKEQFETCNTDQHDSEISNDFDQGVKAESKILLPPVYVDRWGHMVNWTDRSEGWNEAKRRSLFQIAAQIVKQQSTIRSFTKTGWEKLKIPVHLYEVNGAP